MREAERDVERGKMLARLDTLEREMGTVSTDIKAILAHINKAKGGWRTILAVAGVAGAVGATAGKFLPFFNCNYHCQHCDGHRRLFYRYVRLVAHALVFAAKVVQIELSYFDAAFRSDAYIVLNHQTGKFVAIN